MKNCHDKPNQTRRNSKPRQERSSVLERSARATRTVFREFPKRVLLQLRKKKTGPNKYRNGSNKAATKGIKSIRNAKNSISAIKKIEPGNPKKIRRFARQTRKSLGQRKLIPEISVIKRVLKRRLIASTSRNEFDDRRAWLISIQNPASKRGEFPLRKQIVNQCISTTVEYATNFFKSI